MTWFIRQGIQGGVLLVLLCFFPGLVSGQETHSVSKQVSASTGSVSTTVRCKEGIILSHNYQKSHADVEIVEEGGVDCNSEGCPAWMVTAKTDNETSFDLGVDLVCTGEGKDAIERMLEAMQQNNQQGEE